MLLLWWSTFPSPRQPGGQLCSSPNPSEPPARVRGTPFPTAPGVVGKHKLRAHPPPLVPRRRWLLAAMALSTTVGADPGDAVRSHVGCAAKTRISGQITAAFKSMYSWSSFGVVTSTPVKFYAAATDGVKRKLLSAFYSHIWLDDGSAVTPVPEVRHVVTELRGAARQALRDQQPVLEHEKSAGTDPGASRADLQESPKVICSNESNLVALASRTEEYLRYSSHVYMRAGCALLRCATAPRHRFFDPSHHGRSHARTAHRRDKAP